MDKQYENTAEAYTEEFTKRPCEAVIGEYSANEVFGPYGKEGITRLCRVWGDSAEADANTHLFAAASEMYWVIIELLAIARRNETGDFIQRAEAVLAKARGEK